MGLHNLMTFLKYTMLFFVIICNIVSMHAMEECNRKITKLLEIYPPPSIATSWLLNVLGCNKTRELVHKRAVKQAHRKRDALKGKVFHYVYAGYFQHPQLLWFARDVTHRQKDGKRLLNAALKAKRDDLAALLLAHLAPLRGSNGSIQYALDLARAREIIPLLTNCGVDIDALNGDGHTLLSCYAFMGDSDKVSMLLSCGADVNRGYTVLPQLYQVRNNKMISLLLAGGAAVDAVEGDVEIDHFYHAIQKTVFHYAIERNDDDSIQMFLQNALFEPKKIDIVARQKRVIATLCLFKRYKVSRDVTNKILSYLPEDAFNKNHCLFLLRRGVQLDQLVPHCRFSWLKSLYQETDYHSKSNFLEKMIPMIVSYRMGKVKELLNSTWLLDIYSLNCIFMRIKRVDISPVVISLLNLNNVEQHRVGIEKSVRNALLDGKK